MGDGLRTALTCGRCSTTHDPIAFIDGITVAMPTVHCALHVCASCGAREEIGVERGEISFGYIYGAGGPHWAAMEPIAVPGLVASRSDAVLALELGGWHWDIPRSKR